MVKRRKINNWIVACFLTETNICGIITALIPIQNISVLVMAIILICLIAANKKFQFTKNQVIWILVIIFVLTASTLLSGLETSISRAYYMHFLVFGLTAFLAVTIEIDFNSVLINMSRIYFVCILAYFFINRNTLKTSVDYWDKQMAYAFAIMPAIIVSAALLLYKKNLYDFKGKLFLWVINISSLYIVVVDCGTRGAIVSTVLGVLILAIGKVDSRKRVIVIFALGVAAILIVTNIVGVLIVIRSGFEELNISIPSLDKMLMQLSEGDGTGGRGDIYMMAWNCIQENPLLGHGVGYFEKISGGVYTHQFVLQLLCEYGVVVTVVVLLELVRNVRYFISNCRFESGLFYCVLFLISMPILLTSSSYWILPQFWYYFFKIVDKKQMVQEN